MGRKSKKEEIHVYKWLIHFAVQQKITQHCTPIKIGKRKKAPWGDVLYVRAQGCPSILTPQPTVPYYLSDYLGLLCLAPFLARWTCLFFSLCTLIGENGLWCGLETNMELPLGPWTWGQLSKDWCDGHSHGDSKIPTVSLQVVILGDWLPRVGSWTVYNSNFYILWMSNNHFVDCLP